MLKSMTGFGSAQRTAAGYQVTVEAKAVNGRFLKTQVRLPAFLAAHESALETLVKEALRRGSVTVSVTTTRGAEEAAAVFINEPVVRAYQAAFARLGLAEQNIAQLPGVIGQPKAEEAGPALTEALHACARAALEQLNLMRQREGDALLPLLLDLCRQLEEVRLEVRARAPDVVLEYQKKLGTRLAALLAGTEVTVDDAALAREVALFADRSDITEELDRLGVHLAEAVKQLTDGDEAGRTLEFLAQEMHREINTLGSKSADSKISMQVVRLKGDLERFKEQIANVQ